MKGLGFQDKFAPWTKVSIHFLEKALYTSVPPVEMDPLGKTESQDDIKLRGLSFNTGIICWNIVTLAK